MGRVRQAQGGVQRIVQREAGRWQGRSCQPPAGADGLAGGGDISDHIPRGGHAEQATGALWPSRQKQGLWGAGSREAEPSRTPGRALCRGFRME